MNNNIQEIQKLYKNKEHNQDQVIIGPNKKTVAIYMIRELKVLI